MPSKKKTDKYPKVVTPKMVLVYPFLQRPRDFKGDGQFYYKTDATLGGAEAAELEKLILEQIDVSAKKHKLKKKAAPPFTADVDDDDKETGLTRFRFKVRHQMKTKSGDVWDRKPRFFDAQGHPMPDGILLGTGTKAQISFQWYHWKSGSLGAGVTMQPVAVMVHELVEYGGRSQDPGAYGFDTDDEGYGFPGVDDEPDVDDDEEDIDEDGGDF